MSLIKTEEESSRLEALKGYSILDTPNEQRYDDITLLASEICDTPIALISFLDERRQWFKSIVGLDVPETPRELAFCNYTIKHNGVFEVQDALEDKRFNNNPLVTGDPWIRFYAGAPLTTPDGYNLGALCVIDRVARNLTQQQQAALEALARQVIAQLELQRAVRSEKIISAELKHEIKSSKNQENLRRQAEIFMRGSIDTFPDHVAIMNSEGKIVLVNKAWNVFEQKNLHAEEFLRPSTVENYLEACQLAGSRGNSYANRMYTRLLQALGSESDSENNFEFPISEDNDSDWYIFKTSSFEHLDEKFAVITHQNITRRKIAENRVLAANKTLEEKVQERTLKLEQAFESLKRSEQKFRSFIDNASVSICVCDSEGNIQDRNAKFLELFRIQSNVENHGNIVDYVHSEEKELFKTLVSQLVKGEISGFFKEFRVIRQGEKDLWSNVSVASIKNERDENSQLMIQIRDISGHKRVEFERDKLFDVVVDMFAIFDIEGKIYSVNPSCSRVLGFSQEEMTRLNYKDLLHPDDVHKTIDRLNDIRFNRVQDDEHYLEVRMKNKLGDYRFIRWSSTLWENEDCFVASGRDITHHRLRETQLRALAARLQNIREEERRKISREIHDELGQLLTALKIDMKLCGKDILEGKLSNPGLLRKNIDEMIGLVDTTLQSVKRIAQDLRPDVLDSLGLVAAIEWQSRELQERTGISVRLVIDDKMLSVDEKESTELFRIVQESLTNIVRHADANNVQITLNSSADDLSIIIQDDGRGLREQELSRLSLGILGMEERASSIGAVLSIENGKINGAVVTIYLTKTER